MLESNAYKTYYVFASGEKTPKPKYVQKKVDSDTSPKQKLVQATKGTIIKSEAQVAKSDKKKQHAKKPKAKGLAVLSEVALTEAEQLKLAARKTFTYHKKVAQVMELTLRVLDVPIYESESEKESWGDSDEEDDDDEDDFDDDSDDNDESDDERTKSDRDEIPDPNKTNEEHNEEEEEYDNEFNIEEDEKIDDEEMMNDDEEDEVTMELYDDVNVNLGNEDTEMTNADVGASKQQNVSQKSGFDQVEEDAHVTLTPHATAIPKITSSFTTIVPLPPPFFNPLLPQPTPTLTPTASDTTTSLPALPDFASVFKFNERVTNLEKDLSEIKQVDQEEAQAEKREYIELVDSMVRTIIKEEFNAQLTQILPQAILDVATPVIEKNVTESLEAAVLTSSSSQPCLFMRQPQHSLSLNSQRSA
ncbi:hypothetical protein Tco_1111937 [Tanacetum coccineum]|uniref:Uncharacterized protein n=1 Tax=Tanacetum coccineum TaxID=301880 RepID=A0ABQ5IN14_9ASTR